VICALPRGHEKARKVQTKTACCSCYYAGDGRSLLELLMHAAA